MKNFLLIAAVLMILAALVWRQRRPAPPAGLAESGAREALEKLKTFEEILRLKNDNDPRLDRDFNDLSPQAKRMFRRKYRQIEAERLNERGTIVFILGQNLNSAEDWSFLRGVVGEPPCLSLRNCRVAMKPGNGHPAVGIEVSLAYPAMVALKLAQGLLEETRAAGDASSPAAQEARTVIQAAKNSKAPIVARMAASLDKL